VRDCTVQVGFGARKSLTTWVVRLHSTLKIVGSRG
jgi:hypothetical protein